MDEIKGLILTLIEALKADPANPIIAANLNAVSNLASKIISVGKLMLEYNKSRAIEAKQKGLKRIDEALAKLDKAPFDSKQKERIKVWLEEIRRNLTTDTLEPILNAIFK